MTPHIPGREGELVLIPHFKDGEPEYGLRGGVLSGSWNSRAGVSPTGLISLTLLHTSGIPGHPAQRCLESQVGKPSLFLPSPGKESASGEGGGSGGGGDGGGYGGTWAGKGR